MSDTIIKVDRSVKIEYPSWKQLVHPELERIGPEEYDVNKIKCSIHKRQECNHDSNQWMYLPQWRFIYNHLLENKLLGDCMGLHDLLMIMKKGDSFVTEYFWCKQIIGWKSVMKDKNGCIWFPSILGHEIWWNRYDRPANNEVKFFLLK